MDYDNSEIEVIGAKSGVTELTLLMKIQQTGRDWATAPEEIKELRHLLKTTDNDISSWPPKKVGINLLTPNKVRALVLKKVLMKLYPFDSFWVIDTLEETLQKCLLVCQQLGMESKRTLVWGQCTMDESYQFWRSILRCLPEEVEGRKKEDTLQEAKSKVISALIASRGTDWDKQIARNFDEGLGRNKLQTFLSNMSNPGLASAGGGKTRLRANLKSAGGNWRAAFQHVFDRAHHDNSEAAAVGAPVLPPAEPHPPLTTTSFASKLKHESEDMIEALRNIEKYYLEDCVLQIDTAFELGYKVCELADEFEGYMATNNRGAFRDVDALTYHTDKVIRAMSKITSSYQSFFLEFQKYFGSGRGDEINMNLPLFPFPADMMENK